MCVVILFDLHNNPIINLLRDREESSKLFKVSQLESGRAKIQGRQSDCLENMLSEYIRLVQTKHGAVWSVNFKSF